MSNSNEYSYYAVFFDIALERNSCNAMYKRITEAQYRNLQDDMPDKSVELKTHSGEVSQYKIKSFSTFNICNTVDNSKFLILDCEKIKIETK